MNNFHFHLRYIGKGVRMFSLGLCTNTFSCHILKKPSTCNLNLALISYFWNGTGPVDLNSSLLQSRTSPSLHSVHIGFTQSWKVLVKSLNFIFPWKVLEFLSTFSGLESVLNAFWLSKLREVKGDLHVQRFLFYLIVTWCNYQFKTSELIMKNVEKLMVQLTVQALNSC